MYSLKMTTAPVGLAVPIEEAKKQIEVAQAITYHDDQIERLINAATHQATIRTGRQPITATFDFKIDRFSFGSDRIELPLTPLQSVKSIAYTDANGDTQILSTDVYTVLTNQEPGQIVLSYNQAWPSIRKVAEDITVAFVAGYADTAAEFAANEELFKTGILLLVESYMKQDFDAGYQKRIDSAYSIFEMYRVGDDFVEFG